jgi:hypothetical protein
LLYVLVIIGLIPLLDYEPSSPELALHGHEGIKEVFTALRKGKGRTEELLIQAAKEQFEALRASKNKNNAVQAVKTAEKIASSGIRSGFVVLGMHRSGTSMLSGLLVTGCGYNVGGPLIGAKFDNEKGFFERIDIVLQNDEFMSAQNMWWAAGVINYDYEKALEHKKTGRIKFKEGERGLAFLNDPNNAPWLQKDPRMCITLKTWLKLLNTEPAVVFTYRHPLEVAMSLKKREKGFTLEQGLRLWIVYNMRAVQNSAGLCRVLSSNEAILSDPLGEVQRISDELTEKCHVPAPERTLTEEDVHKFVDPTLQHNKKKREAGEVQRKILEEHEGCAVRDYDSDLEKGSDLWKSEHDLYLKAMQVYCDYQSGKAYKDDYAWPEL